MPLLPADFTHAKDCKLNLRKNVDTTQTQQPTKQVADIFYPAF